MKSKQNKIYIGLIVLLYFNFKTMSQDNNIIFCVESCQNCKDHHWNTRHDEAKYQEFFKKVAGAIIERIPNAMVMKNQIPKQYLPFDLYNNLVPNNEEDTPYFQQIPRTGAFEISFKGMLVFSKLKGGYWPNCELVADKCYNVVQNDQDGRDCSQYLAGNSPTKTGGIESSAKKGKTGQKSPSKARPEATPMPFAIETTSAPLKNDQSLRQASTTQVKAGQHLKSSAELTSLPVFPAGTSSLLCKFLTPQVWDQLAGKSDPHGFAFQDAIFSGCKNVDSGIGVYAGSHESYTTFSPLFDKIIEQYHGHSKTAMHKAETGVQLMAPAFSEEEAKLIRSTRIRVGRNLDGFALGPGLRASDRAKIESTVIKALDSFDGDLKGKYYSLSGMSAAVQKQLIEDHFLFKEGDRFLEACGLNREWPANRGIFHNDAKTFLVWVNEEDQLRIISMQPGANIKQVFERLMSALAKFEKVAKFSYDDHLGFITSCPTNLGTAMRASCHMHLPLLSQDKKLFNEIADKHHVQIRGAHGEHTETNDGIFDISNKRRLGFSMTTLAQGWCEGVKAMLEKEIELQKKAGPAKASPATKAPVAAAAAKKPIAAPAKPVKAGSHLKKPEDITGPIAFPADCKSLLCKYLTPAVHEKYRGQKDKAGVSFEQMILSGAQNVDSGIGVYAGSHDSYYTFSDLFDNVINEYHTHKKDAKHVSNMDYTQLKCPPFSADEASMIVSTRIRVGRNLADFPLGPGISKDQRNQVETLVSKACKAFTGELAGTYYALGSMSEADRKQLIDDHFLFKEGDRFLEACGLNRDWPAGRGIFHNKQKTFLIWVNEEDQLRIISMQQGADILAVFTRLSQAATLIEKEAKFAHDDHLGYITSCPTNLGTALRASVHIKLPFLAKNKAQFNKIADEFYVQIRGIHGEHTETDDGVFDISNKRRLGRSEKDLVQDMYNGVKAMITAEKALAAAAKGPSIPVKAGTHLKKPEDITGMVQFPADCKSLLCKYLTPAVYEKYAGKKDKEGVSFEQMILSGSQNIDSGIGCYAGSHDSYYTFSDLFDKVIQDYHTHDKNAKHVSNMDYKQLNCPPLDAEDAAMILSTRIRVGRNLADFPLGPGISKEQRDKVEELVSKACKSFTGELAGTYYALSSLSEKDRKQLIEDHFLFKEGDRFLESCGLNRNWPEGRGIFHNKEKTFLIWVNEEDQLRIISMQKGADILAVFTRLSNAATLIEKEAKFAHDDHLGYITSCPTNLGTALRASVHIKLPFLAKNKEQFNKIADKYYVQIRGIHGEHTETDDGIFDISNKRRLGRSEKDLVQDMYSGVKAMIEAEKALAASGTKKVAGIKAGTHLKKPEDITGPIEFPADCKSLLCKYLTPEVYAKYAGKKDKAGVAFEQMILSGAQNVDSGIGIYAGSHDSYTTFCDIFDKVIEDYHMHKKDAKHVSNMDHTQLVCPPFTEDEASMIVSTRIRVGRNLADFPLGPGISKEQRDKVEELVSKACKSFTGELEGTYYALGSMSEADRKQLIEDHFLFKEGDRFLESCGLNRNWPEGRGIFHNKEKTFLIWVNEEDQLRIISMQKGADIKAVFTRLSTAATLIEKEAKFAHDEHLGYITSCPTNLGTALRASVHIKLPLLGKNKEQFNKIADEFYVQIRGIHGEHTETDDGVFDISNKRRLGRSEKDLVQDMYNGVKAMITAEKALAAAKK